jgi:hypothetical protein
MLSQSSVRINEQKHDAFQRSHTLRFIDKRHNPTQAIL